MTSKKNGEVFDESSSKGGIQAKVGVVTVKRFKAEPIGAIITGFHRAATAQQGKVDTSHMFPAASGNSPAPVNTSQEQWEKRNTDEIELGRELFQQGGVALLHLGFTREQWSRTYDLMVRAAQGGGFAGSGTGDGGLTPPLPFPTAVTSPWGTRTRKGIQEMHRGVDLRADVGTPVRAPADGKIFKTWTEKGGGNCMSVALKRPDGGYADDTTVSDDSGIVITFVHLNDFVASEGQEVRAGDVVAHSGNTGEDSDGAHLHVMAEYANDVSIWNAVAVNDKGLQGRILMDPADVWGGEEVLTGQVEPHPPHVGDVIDAAVVSEDSAHRVVGVGNIIVEASGSLVWAGATAQGALRVVYPKVLMAPSGDGGLDGPSSSPSRGPSYSSSSTLPDMVREKLVRLFGPAIVGEAERAAVQGGLLLRESGGHIVGVALNPATHQAVLRSVGVATGAAGAAAGVLGPVLSTLSPFLTAIPYVGAVLSSLGEAAGAVLNIAGPALGVLGGVETTAANLFNPGIAGGLGIPNSNIPGFPPVSPPRQVPNPPGPIPSVANVAPGILPF